ncbi:MAG: hypothetical protein ACE5LH_01875 [Fidelibacterota bacterium]
MKKVMSLASGTTVVLVIAILMSPGQTGAIPSFARKYETSCQTCHVAYPKLTPFGEAFRQNGFQWPGDIENEEANIKDEQVELGAEAYKRVFPRAVWPGAIPGKVPISFRARTGFTWEKHEVENHSAFQQPTLQLLTGGTLGDNVGFFIGAHLFEEGRIDRGSVDRFYLKLNNLFSGRLPDHSLYVRVGQFIPEMVTFASNHRGLTLSSYAFNTYSPAAGPEFAAGHVHGGGDGQDEEEEGHVHGETESLVGPQFGIEFFQLGIEASGILGHRFRYVAGLVNGGTGEENNASKDGYFRLAYKIGGMGYDGTGGAGTTGRNWVDNSLALGLFGYRGFQFNQETSLNTNLEIQRLGLDFNGFLGSLNLYGGYLRGKDQVLKPHGDGHIHDTGTETDQEFEIEATVFDLVFAEANYLLFPWLVGVLRFEQATPREFGTIRRIVPSVTILYRANIKFIVESTFNPDDPNLNTLQVGLDFAY